MRVTLRHLWMEEVIQTRHIRLCLQRGVERIQLGTQLGKEMVGLQSLDQCILWGRANRTRETAPTPCHLDRRMVSAVSGHVTEQAIRDNDLARWTMRRSRPWLVLAGGDEGGSMNVDIWLLKTREQHFIRGGEGTIVHSGHPLLNQELADLSETNPWGL